MIIDGLAFITGPDEHGPGDVPELLVRMSELGIGRALVCGSKQPDGRSPNVATAQAVREHPGALTGLIRLSPWARDWPAELDRYAGDPGFSGVLLHPWEDGFAVLDPGPLRITERSAGLSLPVTVAAGYPWVSEALQVGVLASQFPGTTFVLSNEGQLNISGLGAADVALLLEQAPNVVLHTTGAYREDFLITLASRYGPQRLMYASGYPRFSPEYELRRVQWAGGISAGAKAHILSATAEAVFRGRISRPDPGRGERRTL